MAKGRGFADFLPGWRQFFWNPRHFENDESLREDDQAEEQQRAPDRFAAAVAATKVQANVPAAASVRNEMRTHGAPRRHRARFPFRGDDAVLDRAVFAVPSPARER